jgi:CNT family concentrative nucleoside transporter
MMERGIPPGVESSRHRLPLLAPSPPPTPLTWRLALVSAVLAVGATAILAASQLGTSGQAACGVLCFLGTAAACSRNLRAINWHTVGWGIGLQVLLALLVLKIGWTRAAPPAMVHDFQVAQATATIGAGPLGPLQAAALTQPAPPQTYFYRPGYEFFRVAGNLIKKLLQFSENGAIFVFGPLADTKKGFIFAFAALPTIVFISSFFTVLYYFGVLQFVVRVVAWVMSKLMRTSGAETLSVTANVFMGQTEAPLIVKPYVERLTRSELLALMVGGMAHISGGLMAVYIGMGADPVAILATSVMASPCSLYLAKIVLPETGTPETLGVVKARIEQTHANVIDAAASGASDGMRLAINIAAMLIAFLAFIALIDAVLPWFAHNWNQLVGLINVDWNWLLLPDDLSLARIFGSVFAPVARLMGVEAGDARLMGDLLGRKLVANEFVAYTKFREYVDEGKLSERSRILATYALTGFANIASIGIQIGGIGALAPSRRSDLAQLGGWALLTGFLVTLINASLAGLLM